MARTGIVQSVERVVRDDVPLVEVRVDLGGGELLTLEHFDSCGEDSLPLPGDCVAISDSTGSGAARAAGYIDTKNTGEALPGEKNIYGRAPSGSIVGFVRIAPGLVDIQGLAAGTRYRIGPVEIDAQGNITTPGDITVKKDTTPVTLSLHKHGTGTGPSTPPLPA